MTDDDDEETEIQCYYRELEFVLFMSERARMLLRKLRGDVLLSACPCLRGRHWCNNYREHDRGTRFAHAFVVRCENENDEQIDRRMQKKKKTMTMMMTRRRQRLQYLFFPLYVYRLVNRTSSFVQTGFPTPSLRPTTATVRTFVAAAHAIRRKRKQPFFTGAHQTTHLGNLEQFLYNTVHRYETLIPDIWTAAQTGGAKACIQVLASVDGVGTFLAWQIYCDLCESQCLPPQQQQQHPKDDYDYCQLGPGAERTFVCVYMCVSNESIIACLSPTPASTTLDLLTPLLLSYII